MSGLANGSLCYFRDSFYDVESSTLVLAPFFIAVVVAFVKHLPPFLSCGVARCLCVLSFIHDVSGVTGL